MHTALHTSYIVNGIYKVNTCIKFKSLKRTNGFLIDRCGLESDEYMCVYVPCLQPSQAKGSGGGRRRGGDSGSGTRRTNYLAHLKHSLDKVRSIRSLFIAN